MVPEAGTNVTSTNGTGVVIEGVATPSSESYSAVVTAAFITVTPAAGGEAAANATEAFVTPGIVEFGNATEATGGATATAGVAMDTSRKRESSLRSSRSLTQNFSS